MQKFETHDNPFWEFSNGGESKSKKRLITKNSGLPKLLPWSHALRSDQKISCIVKNKQNDLLFEMLNALYSLDTLSTEYFTVSNL